ncbi:MAG: SnoaL-like polyketide cyclase [Solirubrobacteraceae bacterium]|nr:SnoaL-like polyketide cyclase [Solirubrobacteraceae bacterium]
MSEGSKAIVARLTPSAGRRPSAAPATSWASPATGREVAIAGFAMYRLRDGRITEFWGLSDAMGLMQQLGALPEPPGGARRGAA